jgi:hypothetical protein
MQSGFSILEKRFRTLSCTRAESPANLRYDYIDTLEQKTTSLDFETFKEKHNISLENSPFSYREPVADHSKYIDVPEVNEDGTTDETQANFGKNNYVPLEALTGF